MEINDRFLDFDEVERAILFRAMLSRRIHVLNDYKKIVTQKNYNRKDAAKACAEAATLQILATEMSQSMLLDKKTLKLLEPTQEEKVYFNVRQELQARRLS